MVLKKPYGLMIKHFKLLHFILLALSFLVIMQLRPLMSFFNEFIANGYTVTVIDNMASYYINFLVYISLLVMIGLLAMLLILLKYKKKPNKIYLFAIIYYAVLFISIIIAGALIGSLEEGLWSTSSARLYRDIATIVTLPQYFFIPFWLIRALGFNIKQFNFQSDLAELDLSQADSEEIEISLGFETYKYQRKFNRIKREFKYYFYENKIFMYSILAITIVVLIYLFISNFEIYTTKYKTGDSFTFSNLNVKVEDSVITNLNYSGNIIDSNTYFLLLKLTITNNTKNDTALEYNKFLLYGKNRYYLPNIGYQLEFIDYGEAYDGNVLNPGASKTIILPYAINKEDINNNYYISLYNGKSKKKNSYKLKKIVINLAPILIDEIATVQNSKLNDNVVFNSTYLNNTSLTIKDVEVTNRYTYDYEVCNNLGCNTFKGLITPGFSNNTGKALVVLGYDLNIDPTAAYAKVSTRASTFASNFFKIRFSTDDSTYTESVKNVTPDNLKDKLVLEVNNEILNASRIDLLVTIRNKNYVINLK